MQQQFKLTPLSLLKTTYIQAYMITTYLSKYILNQIKLYQSKPNTKSMLII